MLIGELDAALLGAFPAEDAESWDHVGLSVGRPEDAVSRVAVALDPTEANVRRASADGANVLVTHHPVYLKAPDAFVPDAGAHPACASAVYSAIELGVSIISLHTNLDRSVAARTLLPALVGLRAESSIEHPRDPSVSGLGALCAPSPMAISELAERCAAAFGTDPRVWGSGDAPVHRVAFLGGSLGSFGELALRAGADCVVTGEAGYHVCQDLSLRGMAVLLLGHDRSEGPFVNILKDAVRQSGVDGDDIATIDCPNQWWTMTRGDRI